MLFSSHLYIFRISSLARQYLHRPTGFFPSFTPSILKQNVYGKESLFMNYSKALINLFTQITIMYLFLCEDMICVIVIDFFDNLVLSPIYKK